MSRGLVTLAGARSSTTGAGLDHRKMPGERSLGFWT
jgi:hypothetical protein